MKDLLGNVFGILGNLEELLNVAEKLADAKGDERAKQDVKKMREGLKGIKGKVDFETVKNQDLGGIFSQILNFVEKAKKEGGEFTEEFQTPSGKKGVLSFGFNTGSLKDRVPKEEKFTVKRHDPKAQRVKQKPGTEDEMRQPNLDVFDEKDHILIIGDMPGVNKQDIKYELKEKTLRIYTEGGRKYEKEIELPALVTEKIDLSYKNGVLELNLKKKNI